MHTLGPLDRRVPLVCRAQLVRGHAEDQLWQAWVTGGR